MTPLAITIWSELRKHGRMTAEKIASIVDEPVEEVYAALVQLDDADQAYIATQHGPRIGDTNRHARLWAAREAVPA